MKPKGGNMRVFILSAAFLLMVGVTLGVQNQTGTEATHNMGHMMQMMRNCPMHVQGAKVAVADTADGVAVSITTESGKVDELRRRMKLIAEMRDANENRPAMMPNRIPATVKYEEVPNGARLTLTPKDPAQLEALRKQVHKRAERLQNGACSMMQGIMGVQEQEPSANTTTTMIRIIRSEIPLWIGLPK
jgi:hypothetical protein